MAFASLLDLPPEILLLIFLEPELGNNSLLQAGRVCRQLNQILIPFFLHSNGIIDPTGTIVVRPQNTNGRAEDALSALNIYFPLTGNIQQLVCILDISRETESFFLNSPVHLLTKNLLRLHDLVERVSTINSICLVFFSSYVGWSISSPAVQEFLEEVLRLIESAVLKSCSSVQILHRYPTHSRSPVGNPSRLANPSSGSPASLPARQIWGQKILGTIQRTSQQLDPYPNPILPSPTTSLTHLDISSDFLLLPPYSVWTFDLMKNSPVTSLKLSIPRSVSRRDFRESIYPKLCGTLPQLQEFSLAFVKGSHLSVALRRLASFPSLSKFTCSLVHRIYDAPLSPVILSQTHLPELRSITSSPEQALFILSHPFLIPSLKWLNIIIDISLRGQYDYDEISVLFSNINIQLLRKNIKPCISVCLSNYGELPPLSKKNPEDILEIAERFSSVSRLTCKLPIFEADQEEIQQQITYIYAWLEIFQNLEALTLVTGRPASDGAACGTRDATLFAAISLLYPKITNFNVVDLDLGYHHYHWANAGDDLERGIDGIPTAPALRQKSHAATVCSHF